MGEIPISSVQTDGDKISFVVDAGDRKLVHKGEISGDEMKLKVEMGEGTMEMTAKRVGS